MTKRNRRIRPTPTRRIVEDTLGALLIFALGAGLWIVTP